MVMTEIDLHALARAPFGQAEQTIKRLGFWDEARCENPKTFKVTLWYAWTETDEYEAIITGPDEDTAIELAKAQLKKIAPRDCDIIDIEAEEKEAHS